MVTSSSPSKSPGTPRVIGRTAPLETSNLSKRFGDVVALDGLNLRLEPGEIFGLIGPNGAGKTTTMRLLLDVIRPSGGTVRVLGQEPATGGAELRRRIGYLPGELRLEGRTSGRALLRHFARISGPVVAGAPERLAERLGVDLVRPVGKLSKGNKQKVGLIQAFMHEPDLLVLDEPTSGLDPLVQQEFLAMIREASANGQTVLLSSHVLSEIEHAAHRVGVLHRGKLVKLGAMADLRLDRRRRVKAGLRGQRDDVLARLSALQGVSELGIVVSDDEVVLTAVVADIDRFVKAIAGFHVTDLVVAEPVLEETVLELYRDQGANRDA